jgi:hypothetical protein
MDKTDTVVEALDRLLELPAQQRAAVAHGLLRSLEPPAEDSDSAFDWSAELESRLAAVDRGEFADGDWRDVIARVRASIVQNKS